MLPAISAINNIPKQIISSAWIAQIVAIAVPASIGASNGKQHRPQPTIAAKMTPNLDFFDDILGSCVNECYYNLNLKLRLKVKGGVYENSRIC